MYMYTPRADRKSEAIFGKVRRMDPGLIIAAANTRRPRTHVKLHVLLPSAEISYSGGLVTINFKSSVVLFTSR